MATVGRRPSPLASTGPCFVPHSVGVLPKLSKSSLHLILGLPAMDCGNGKEGRAPGGGAMNSVLSHFHWVGLCLVRLAGLIKMKMHS